ncbi:MAG: formylmethanofuran dehydrogenase subunit B [Gemmataceae bacterium]|nr:formylmethanofuran dehydrogenase subunit B [Gemmataceae bacterium]
MEVFENIACTVCGCVCDDLRVTVDRGRIVQAAGACSLAEPWFLGQDTRQPPVAEIEGQSVPLEAALKRAAEILRSSASPLIYGLARSSTDGQRAAVSLAEFAGATIDTNAALCHAPSISALQEVGESTCTLGEAKNRADLVIFWGSNPVESHPRHLERYSLFPKGRCTADGRAGRTLVVADVKPTATSHLADVFLTIEPGRDFEVLTTLRSLVRGTPVTTNSPGAPIHQLKDLAQRMKACRYGVVFFGLGLSMTGRGQHNVEALLLLVTDLNAHTRFCARRMRIQGDVAGADTVLTWQTGYPFAVNMARGYPRYNPGEFSAPSMLEQKDVDACLLVGSEGIVHFSEPAMAHLRGIPTIALDYPTVPSYLPPTVRFTTSVYGVHQPGTAYRMDGVPIPLRTVLPSAYPSDGDVLRGIQKLL